MFNQTKPASIITIVAIFGSLAVLGYLGVIIADNYVNSPLVSVEVETEKAKGAGTTADFIISPKPDNPLQINFTDQSLGDIQKWNWDFGDGDIPVITSHQRNPNGTLVNIAIDTIPIISKNIIVARSFEINDLNHNNIGDPILYYYDLISNSLVNTGGIAVGPKLSISNGLIAFVTTEYNMGIDLNGDGKLSNHIVMYYDLRENKIVSTGAETSDGHSPSISGDIIAFVTNEISIGKDLDGNGLINDWVVRYFDIKTGEVFNTKGEIFVNAHPFVSGNLIAFPTYEIDYGSDLNGDGDKLDMVLRYFNIVDGNLVNTRAEMVGGNLTILRNKIAFISRETSIGATGADLNGDGDKNDYVARYFDISSGKIINTGAEIKANHGKIPGTVAMSEHILAFTTLESSVGSAGADLNSDGDMQDDILRYYDFFSETIVNTGAEIFLNPFIDGKIIAFQTDERTVGRQGVDLNGDGDMGGLFPDRIARYFDVAIGNLRNTAAEMSGADVPISGNVITFGVSENAIGPNGFDFNENGSVQDRFLRYFLINGVPATSNTSHIYANHGSYTVTLTVTDKNGVSNSVTKVIEVREAVPAPLAAFTAAPVSGLAPLTVNFTDTSTNAPTSWQWDIDNNGTIDYTTQNPSHTYNTPGTYSVSLTVSNIAGSDTETKLNYITVASKPNNPPVLNPIGDKQVNEGQTLSFLVSAIDSDNNPLTYSASPLPVGASFNLATQTFSWTPNFNQSGIYSNVHFEVSDGKLADSEDIAIVVNDVVIPQCSDGIDNDNDSLIDFPQDPGCSSLTDDDETDIPQDNPPISNAGPDQEVYEGEIVYLDGTASYDPDGDPLTSYQWTQTKGKPVVINNADSSIASFIAPDVVVFQNNNNPSLYATVASSLQIIIEFFQSIFAEETKNQETLEFQLIAVNNEQSLPDTVQIVVKPEQRPVSVIIASPRNNQIVSPKQRIFVKADVLPDNANVKLLQFLITDQNNNLLKKKTDKRSPYQFYWNVPRKAQSGSVYYIQAKAYDANNALMGEAEKIGVVVR